MGAGEGRQARRRREGEDDEQGLQSFLICVLDEMHVSLVTYVNVKSKLVFFAVQVWRMLDFIHLPEEEALNKLTALLQQ